MATEVKELRIARAELENLCDNGDLSKVDARCELLRREGSRFTNYLKEMKRKNWIFSTAYKEVSFPALTSYVWHKTIKIFEIKLEFIFGIS